MAMLTHGGELIIQYRADISFLKMLREHWMLAESAFQDCTIYFVRIKFEDDSNLPAVRALLFRAPTSIQRIAFASSRSSSNVQPPRRKRVFTAAVTFNHGTEHANDPNSPKARQIQFVSKCGGCGFCAIDRQPPRGCIP